MWVRRVCCSDVGMEGVAVVVDGEGFVGCVRGGLQWKHSPQDYFKTFVPDPDQLWNFKTIYQAPGKLSDRVAEASNAIRVGISDL